MVLAGLLNATPSRRDGWKIAQDVKHLSAQPVDDSNEVGRFMVLMAEAGREDRFAHLAKSLIQHPYLDTFLAMLVPRRVRALLATSPQEWVEFGLLGVIADESEHAARWSLAHAFRPRTENSWNDFEIDG